MAMRDYRVSIITLSSNGKNKVSQINLLMINQSFVSGINP